MVPAFVAPSVMVPPSSPAETTSAPGPCASVSRQLPLPSKIFPYPTLFRFITVYVPLVGAFTATFPAPCPVALFLRSTPVGDTSRDQEDKSALPSPSVPVCRALHAHSMAVNVQVSRSPR